MALVAILETADLLADVIDHLNPGAATYMDDYGAVVTVNP